MSTRPSPAGARQAVTPVDFDVPAGACDCHVHIFGDPEKFPFSPGRAYTPEVALPEELSALHEALHLQRVVVVTSNAHGTDNSSTLYGMRDLGAGSRGIAVIGDDTPESELDAMDRAGVRGIRLNFATVGLRDPSLIRRQFQAAAERMERRRWHVQIFSDPTAISILRDLVAVSPVPVVFDHFGSARADLGTEQPGFPDLVELVRSGKAYVKISGAYRASKLAPDYPDVRPLAESLIAANPDRILWGTDWPHTTGFTPPGRKPTDVTPSYRIDDGRLLNQLASWAREPEIREKILVSTPARLYGF